MVDVTLYDGNAVELEINTDAAGPAPEGVLALHLGENRWVTDDDELSDLEVADAPLAYAGFLCSRYSYPEIMEALQKLGASSGEAESMVDALSDNNWDGLGDQPLSKQQLLAHVENFRSG